MEYLGFWLTRDGVKDITKMKPSAPQKEVRKFIGVINCYRNMWPRRSHMLAPLTILTSIKRKFRWTQVEQDAFDKIKRIVARDTLLTCPYFNRTFKIHTNASTFQLGAFISKKDIPIALYGRKLTDTQQQYAVTYR